MGETPHVEVRPPAGTPGVTTGHRAGQRHLDGPVRLRTRRGAHFHNILRRAAERANLKGINSEVHVLGMFGPRSDPRP